MCDPVLVLKDKRAIRTHLYFIHANRSDEYLEMHCFNPVGVRNIGKGYKVSEQTYAAASRIVQDKVKHVVRTQEGDRLASVDEEETWLKVMQSIEKDDHRLTEKELKSRIKAQEQLD